MEDSRIFIEPAGYDGGRHQHRGGADDDEEEEDAQYDGEVEVEDEVHMVSCVSCTPVGVVLLNHIGFLVISSFNTDQFGVISHVGEAAFVATLCARRRLWLL